MMSASLGVSSDLRQSQSSSRKGKLVEERKRETGRALWQCREMEMMAGSEADMARLEEGAVDWEELVGQAMGLNDVDELLARLEKQLYKEKTSADQPGAKRLASYYMSSMYSTRSNFLVSETEYMEVLGAEEDEVPEETTLYTFDFGKVEARVSRLVRLLDSSFLPAVPMDDLGVSRSLYTSTRANLARFGLKVPLSRLVLFVDYGTLSTRSSTVTQDKENALRIPPREEENFLKSGDIQNILYHMVSRTNDTFGNELGIISGSLLVYSKYIVLMIEAPELCILDFFLQLSKHSLLENFLRGSIFLINQNVLVRFLSEWCDMEAPAFMLGTPLESSADKESVEATLELTSRKLRRMWSKMRSSKLLGRDRTWAELGSEFLLEEDYIELALSCGRLRPLEDWLRQVTDASCRLSELEMVWPNPLHMLPTTAHRKDPELERLGVTLLPEDLLWALDQELDQFLDGRLLKKMFDQSGEQVWLEEYHRPSAKDTPLAAFIKKQEKKTLKKQKEKKQNFVQSQSMSSINLINGSQVRRKVKSKKHL